jgi:hypothetical protein
MPKRGVVRWFDQLERRARSDLEFRYSVSARSSHHRSRCPRPPVDQNAEIVVEPFNELICAFNRDIACPLQ